MNRKFYPYAPLPKAAPVVLVVEDDAEQESAAFARHRAKQRAPMVAEPGPIADAPGFVARAAKIIKRKGESA